VDAGPVQQEATEGAGQAGASRIRAPRPVQRQRKAFINPVCGMAVSTANPMHIEIYEGVSYYFCCDGCRTTFQKEPAKYAAIHHASVGGVPA
jgi:YHS domain-containing protein